MGICNNSAIKDDSCSICCCFCLDLLENGKFCSNFRSPHLPLDRLVEYGPFNPQNETCFLRWPTTVAAKEITVTFTVKRKDSPKKWKTSRQKEKDSLQKKKPPSPHALFYAARTLLFFLPRGYFFSRESFTFNLPWRLFFLLWGFFFSREAFPFSREVLHFAVSIFLCWEVISFTVTVVGHRSVFWLVKNTYLTPLTNQTQNLEINWSRAFSRAWLQRHSLRVLMCPYCDFFRSYLSLWSLGVWSYDTQPVKNDIRNQAPVCNWRSLIKWLLIKYKTEISWRTFKWGNMN